LPEARGRGWARRLLTALEDAARELGYRRVRLDTGRLQPAALALYPAAGDREIADYNGNPFASYWGEKDLAATGY
jgi:GNAT superfamily N-acetyltransferase